MKQIIIITAVLFAAFTLNLEAKGNYHGVGGYFYTELSPYGTWIEIDYGVVVWRPTIINMNWMPYNMGRWIYTYDGWYWDSYEPFGHITYHYGRWFYDDYYGWLWYPDYEWAPAWVEWRYDNDYIGWAPLHPYAFFSISIGIHFTSVYSTPYYHWHFVSYKHFCHPYVYNYYVAPKYRYRIYYGTKYRTKYVYYNGRIQNRGIDVGYIQTRSGQKIKQRELVRVRDSRELNRDNNRKRDEIRTLDVERSELVRNDLNRMEIKRENRSTNLKMDKVEIGKREIKNDDKSKSRDIERNDNIKKNDKSRLENNNVQRKEVENVRTENNKNNDRKVNNSEIIRKDNQNDKRTLDRNTKSNNGQEKLENKSKRENKVRINEISEIRNNTPEQKTTVKRDNSRTNVNNQVIRNEEKEKVKTNNSRNKNTDTRVNKNRTTEKDNSRERSRR